MTTTREKVRFLELLYQPRLLRLLYVLGGPEFERFR